jgi:hypothetical protein
MGQRHQLFLKVHNPVKKMHKDSPDMERGIKLFGRGDTTIIGFHHQWLYGRSAVVKLGEILTLSNPSNMNGYENPFSSDFSSIYDLDNYIKRVTSMVSVSFDSVSPRGYGIERFNFLNEDESWVLERFDYGDNNDGITIIDTIERKYCMMNINTPYDDDNSDVYLLPQYEPCTSKQYVDAYYPNHKRDNNKFIKGSKGYSILSKNEILLMFPKFDCYQVVTK